MKTKTLVSAKGHKAPNIDEHSDLLSLVFASDHRRYFCGFFAVDVIGTMQSYVRFLANPRKILCPENF